MPLQNNRYFYSPLILPTRNVKWTFSVPTLFLSSLYLNNKRLIYISQSISESLFMLLSSLVSNMLFSNCSVLSSSSNSNFISSSFVIHGRLHHSIQDKILKSMPLSFVNIYSPPTEHQKADISVHLPPEPTKGRLSDKYASLTYLTSKIPANTTQQSRTHISSAPGLLDYCA